MQHYRLEKRKPVPCSMQEWVEWFGNCEMADRRIGRALVDGYTVSTVFMGIDTSAGESRTPRGVFETRVEMESGDGATVAKYAEWSVAQQGHDRVLQVLRELVNESQLKASDLLARLRGTPAP